MLAAALAVAVVAGGASDIALYALPLLVLAALLLTGRFVGEERILAIWRGIRMGRTRKGARRWPPARPATRPLAVLPGNAHTARPARRLDDLSSASGRSAARTRSPSSPRVLAGFPTHDACEH